MFSITPIPAQVSVIMPTFNQSRFIARAIQSILAQSMPYWELLIINDGATDETEEMIKPFLKDKRISYFPHQENAGLGARLNEGLENAKHHLIAYLPSDDIFYHDHLATLVEHLKHPNTVLAYSGVRHHYNRATTGTIEGYPLQLVQVMHKKTNKLWMERKELVTDDLDRMYWNKLTEFGTFSATRKVTCQWVDHPDQRSKIIREPTGGINPFRRRYGVCIPMRFHSTIGNYIDEVSYYRPFQNKTVNFKAQDGLKILLVGELAYNAERILAFEEQGHKLYGLWTDSPYWFNTIGPLPFGSVEDIAYEGWAEKVKKIQPDIIYALLNWQAVPFAYEVLQHNPGIPFIWHFKEGPFICLEKGTWPQLIDLYTKSDGQIYTSPEMRNWLQQFLPKQSTLTLVLDGDLPKSTWFTNDFSSRISEKDGDLHTFVPGRPIGLHPATVSDLAKQGIHLHFYGDFTHGQWLRWIQEAQTLAPGYLHIHPNCTQENWVQEFSQYDAGWLHIFQSENQGELMRANWDDLNYPARIATFMVAGVPMLQKDNTGHIVATQTLVKKRNLGLFFNTMSELKMQLKDKEKMADIRESISAQRFTFSFDYHVEELVHFFRKVIERKSKKTGFKAMVSGESG